MKLYTTDITSSLDKSIKYASTNIMGGITTFQQKRNEAIHGIDEPRRVVAFQKQKNHEGLDIVTGEVDEFNEWVRRQFAVVYNPLIHKHDQPAPFLYNMEEDVSYEDIRARVTDVINDIDTIISANPKAHEFGPLSTTLSYVSDKFINDAYGDSAVVTSNAVFRAGLRCSPEIENFYQTEENGGVDTGIFRLMISEEFGNIIKHTPDFNMCIIIPGVAFAAGNYYYYVGVVELTADGIDAYTHINHDGMVDVYDVDMVNDFYNVVPFALVQSVKDSCAAIVSNDLKHFGESCSIYSNCSTRTPENTEVEFDADNQMCDMITTLTDITGKEVMIPTDVLEKWMQEQRREEYQYAIERELIYRLFGEYVLDNCSREDALMDCTMDTLSAYTPNYIRKTTAKAAASIAKYGIEFMIEVLSDPNGLWWTSKMDDFYTLEYVDVLTSFDESVTEFIEDILIDADKDKIVMN